MLPRYAGFWLRFCATLIDLVVFMLVISLPLTLIYGESYWSDTAMFKGFWDILIGQILPVVLTLWFWLRYLGTPGKMVLKLEIVDQTSLQKMRPTQAVIRYFAYLVSILPFGLGFIWIAFDKRKQGWHDKLAGTVVVRKTNTGT